jgi:hypothetical protein
MVLVGAGLLANDRFGMKRKPKVPESTWLSTDGFLYFP